MLTRCFVLSAVICLMAPALAVAQDEKKADAPPSEEEAAEQNRDDAEEDHEAAQGEAVEAVVALEHARMAAENAKGALTVAQGKVKEAEGAVAEAEKVLEAAQAEADKAKEAAEAEGAPAEAATKAEAAQASAQAAEAALKVTQEQLATEQKSAEEAETKADELQSAHEKAQTESEAKGKAKAQAEGKAKAAAAAQAAMERAKNAKRGPAMAIDVLRLRLKPLTKEELEKEADLWLEVLKAKATGISYAEIALRDASEDEREVLLEALNTLRSERTAMVDRVEVVLTAFEAKGGDPAGYRSYVSAITGIELGAADDYRAAWSAIVGWITDTQGGLRWGKNLLLFLLTLIAFKFLSALAGKVMAGTLRAARVKTSELLKDFFVNATRKIVFFVGLIVGLSMLEVNIAPFLAAMGGAAFVLGFALQSTLSNFAAGIMILTYRPYDIGDVVEVAGAVGTVSAMSLVSTSLTTPDNQVVIIPNGSIWGGIIKNITGCQQRRVDLVFGISYDDDMAKAEAILTEVVTAHPKVLATPATVIKVNELGDSSVNFVVRPWVKTSDYWEVYWDLTRTVKERFDAGGVSFPYPQTDVHLRQVAAASS